MMLSVLAYNMFETLGTDDYRFTTQNVPGTNGYIVVPANTTVYPFFHAPIALNGISYSWLNISWQTEPTITVSAMQVPPYSSQIELTINNNAGTSGNFSIQALFLVGVQAFNV